MVDNLYRAFVNATRDVFNLMLNISEIKDHPADGFKIENGVDISIGIVGDLNGEVVYRFPASTSINMVKIMSGMQFDEIDAFVASAVSEIANIISGNVLTALSGENLNYNLLPPVQSNSDDKEYENGKSCCIDTSIGEMCLEIKLNSE
ncbi:MAG: chemotaxis protein CheX [Clostridiales bacterium]|jgi:chemotaxis protein CheX|nr:chemotaxis protein CheX [Clostridiales bacterium]